MNMDASLWDNIGTPRELLNHLQQRTNLTTERKLRLLACACFRANATESPRNGFLKEQLECVKEIEVWVDGGEKPTNQFYLIYHEDVRWVLTGYSHSKFSPFVREIFGNPFRDTTWLILRCPLCGQENRWGGGTGVISCPECKVPLKERREFWLEWNGGPVRRIAQNIYDKRTFVDMPILADCLEEAACEDENILNHCRVPSAPHVRGCWVLDLLLGKV